MGRKISMPSKIYTIKKDLPEKYKIDERYQIIKKIGIGNFATVFKAHDLKQNTTVAIKIFNAGDFKKQKISYETKKLLQLSITQAINLKRVDSPYVVKYYQELQNQDETLRILVMQYCQGPTLENYIIDLRENNLVLNQSESMQIFHDVAKGIQALHSCKIMHRDLHPGNIIKNGNKWMILDLGFSKMVCERQEKYKSTNLGAIVVKAPQIINPKCKYGLKVDIWSLGVILFYLLTSRYLLNKTQSSKSPDQILLAIQKRLQIQFGAQSMTNEIQQSQSILKGFRIENQMILFLKKILIFESSQRMSIKQLLNHKYWKKHTKNSTSQQQINHFNVQTKNEDTEITYQQQCSNWLSSINKKQQK